jgi:hypothetical protein
MQAIPVKVKNVKVYPYIDWNGGGIGPVILPVIDGASGTYAVGTLGRSVFYNLDLKPEKSSIGIHQRYFATGENEDGTPFTTPWMYSTNTTNDIEFGRTIRLGIKESEAVNVGNVPPYIVLGPLTDITVTQIFPAPAIGEAILIENGSGNIIATKTGTPHEMGIEVIKGNRLGRLRPGLKDIMITGKNKEGKTVTMGHLTCLDANEPALFLHQFGPTE